ncbi:hypothetical protein HELRODRAFT_124593, partial [Helobdella robusta]|uniref:2-aminoethanethiol dioxygenase n=1 Tax=Helobdella robusta TaxID=6412 RepID=T1EH20_HELRO
APVTYIDVWKDENFTMGVFVLKPGSKIPLHDHPQMYGLIKVIYGSCAVKSFSIKKTSNGSSVDLSFQTPIQVCRHPTVNATTSSDVITLTPDVANFHEISTLETPIAFFDVLFPPYNDEEERSCNYYKEIKNDNLTETELVKIDAPVEYWTNSEVYRGPTI